MIRAILFDCDGVLLDSFEANYAFYVSFMKENGYKVPTKEMYRKRFHLSLFDVVKSLLPKKPQEEIDRLVTIGRKLARERYRNDLMKIPNGLEEVIKTLRKQYKIGLVTSRIRGRVFFVPKLAPFEKYFQTKIYYEDTVKHKPDPEPLLLAAKKLRVKPEECIYIGDSHTDRVAADAAGMKIILYNKTKPDGDVPWTPEFKNLLHLVEILS